MLIYLLDLGEFSSAIETAVAYSMWDIVDFLIDNAADPWVFSSQFLVLPGSRRMKTFYVK